MIQPRISLIQHPSGKLYDAFRRFSAGHPEACWFQGDPFFRFAEKWPEAKPVLLVALRKEKLKDPGIRSSKSLSTSIESLEHSRHSQPFANELLAGSLLAVTIHEPLPARYRSWLFGGLYPRLTARTLVYGGPLLGEGSRLEQEITLKALLAALKVQVQKNSLFTQFRNFGEHPDRKHIFHAMGFSWHDRLNLLVDTSSLETAWHGISTSRRRQVNKSLQRGARIITMADEAQLNEFYAILQRLYKYKIQKPLPSREFFRILASMQQHKKRPGSQDADPGIQEPGVVFLLVTFRNKVIGGIVCPLLPGRSLYEWYVCGLDHEYKPMGIYPSILATWAAISYGARHQTPVFDFMGLGKPDQPYGVRDFKARFGGKWINPGRYSTINNRFLYFWAEVAYNLSGAWQKLFRKRKKHS